MKQNDILTVHYYRFANDVFDDVEAIYYIPVDELGLFLANIKERFTISIDDDLCGTTVQMFVYAPDYKPLHER